jgi:hypothetical protein
MSSVIARKTSSGVPVLFMPYKFPNKKHGKAELVENSLDSILSKIYIDYKPEKTITLKKALYRESEPEIHINVFFVDKICSYLNLYEIVNCMTSSTANNTFVFYELLHYAHYKMDVKLINLLLRKISNTRFLDVSMLAELVEDMYRKNIPIVIPKEYSDDLLDYIMRNKNNEEESLFTRGLFDIFDQNLRKYIIQCSTLSGKTTISILFRDNLELFVQVHNKMKKKVKGTNILHYAIRYESFRTLDYLYSLEKPIKEYIDITFLQKYEIYPDDKMILETIMEFRDLTFIKEMYEHATNLKYLNKRIALFISVRKNDYETVLFLLSKGVKPETTCLVIAAYNGSVEMMKLLVKHGADPLNTTYVYYAAYAGRIEMLKLMYEKGYELGYDIIRYLDQGGNLIKNNLKTLDDLMIPLKDHIMDYVCEDKEVELETIEYLYNKNVKINKHIMGSLSSRGSMEAFRFFMSKGIPIDQHIIGNLATRGQYSIIRNLYNNVVPVISLTGQVGNVSITRFFNQNRQELDYTTVSKGIKYGCFEIKQSFVISGPKQIQSNQILTIEDSPYTQSVLACTNAFESVKQIDCTIYNQLPPVDEGTIQTCARHSHIDLLLFLIARKAPIDADAMYSAIVRGFTEVCILLYQYYPVINQYHIILAKLWNRHEILEYLKDKPLEPMAPYPHAEFTLSEFDYYGRCIQQILYHACSHGELDVIKNYRGSLKIKLIPTIPTFNFNRFTHYHIDMFYTAVLHGQLEVVRYLETKPEYDTVKKDSKYTACAARIGRMDMMRYLVKSGYEVCQLSMANAIEKCRMDFVKYLIMIRAPIPDDALKIAKRYSADDVYEFLKYKML